MDSFIYFGDAVKALDDNGKVGGYLIRFTGPDHKDLVGDYFTKDSYLGAQSGNGADCLFHHGLTLKKGLEQYADHLFAPIKTKVDDIGVFAETVLNLSDKYEEKVFELVKKGKLGWSSGSTSHLVKRAEDGFLKRWPIAEGSLTPTPCEIQNRALEMKSLDGLKFVDLEDTTKPEAKAFDAKGIFADALAEYDRQTWELWSALQRGTKQIVDAARSSSITGVTVDVEATVKQLVDEYAVELAPEIVNQVNDYLNSDNQDTFYLKSVFDPLKSDLACSRFSDHLEAVLAASKEAVNRAQSIHDMRIKAGRMISAANRKKLQQMLDSLGGLDAVKEEITTLLAEGDTTPKSIDPDLIRGAVVGFEMLKMRIKASTGG